MVGAKKYFSTRFTGICSGEGSLQEHHSSVHSWFSSSYRIPVPRQNVNTVIYLIVILRFRGGGKGYGRPIKGLSIRPQACNCTFYKFSTIYTELHDIEGNKNVCFASRVGDEQLYIVGHRAKNNIR